jgi:ADP-heptose:LPS heptosyltransferase
MWKAEHIFMLAVWIKQQGFTPVFIGKTDMNLETHLKPKSSLPDNLQGYGLDLRNRTTMLELAAVIAASAAIVGLDSGPIHLAGCTKTPIVCGYTTVAPEHRVPIRDEGRTYAVIPDCECRLCESNWEAHFHNYERCYYGPDPICCQEMTAAKFIPPLREILNIPF